MKFQKLIGIIIVSTLILVSCSTNKSIQPVKSHNQSLTYQDNFQLLTSEKNLIRITIFPAKDLVEPNEPLEFGLYINNNSNDYLNFSNKNISAYCGNKYIKVYTYEEALTDFEKRNEVSLFGLTPEQISSIERTRSQTNYYQNLNQEYSQYASMLLKRQTIPPKIRYAGLFRIASPNPLCDDPLIIEIMDKRENHKFVFRLQPIQ